MVRAVLLDIDGTLVDSNYLHVETWARAFSELELEVDGWRIHRCIGMDSSRLLAELLGEDASRFGDEAKRLHSRYFMENGPRLRTFAGARELLRSLDGRGLTVVLSTSAPEDELAMLLQVIDSEAAVAAVTSAKDVEEAKPQPDVVEAALRESGVEATEAIFVGDTVWDVVAAYRAGLGCVGVMSGGISRAELVDAGAVAVYEDAKQLLEQLDDSPIFQPVRPSPLSGGA